MDPRIVERKTGAVRDGALASQEERQGDERGQDDECVVSAGAHATARG
jgi:hypothetical protein